MCIEFIDFVHCPLSHSLILFNLFMFRLFCGESLDPSHSPFFF